MKAIPSKKQKTVIEYWVLVKPNSCRRTGARTEKVCRSIKLIAMEEVRRIRIHQRNPGMQGRCWPDSSEGGLAIWGSMYKLGSRCRQTMEIWFENLRKH